MKYVDYENKKLFFDIIKSFHLKKGSSFDILPKDIFNHIISFFVYEIPFIKSKDGKELEETNWWHVPDDYRLISSHDVMDLPSKQKIKNNNQGKTKKRKYEDIRPIYIKDVQYFSLQYMDKLYYYENTYEDYSGTFHIIYQHNNGDFVCIQHGCCSCGYDETTPSITISKSYKDVFNVHHESFIKSIKKNVVFYKTN